MASKKPQAGKKPRLIDRILDGVERAGNALPDPALLFVFALGITWILSAIFDGQTYEIQGATATTTKTIASQVTGQSLTDFLANMVTTFTSFHPLGVVLVALLGVGVAEHSGFINAGLKGMLGFTPKSLLTPLLILVAIVSHTAADAGYVLVIPLGGVIFYAAGRHPLAGIAAAFAGVSGGFSANFIPSGIDPLLSGLTQSGAAVLNPAYQVNPLCNWLFCSASSILIVLVGWFLTDRIIEPRLQSVKIDGDPEDMPAMDPMTPKERRGLLAGFAALLAGVLLLVVVSMPEDSPMRGGPSYTITTKSGGEFEAVDVKQVEGLVYLSGPEGEETSIAKDSIAMIRTSDGTEWTAVQVGAVTKLDPDDTVGPESGDALLFTDTATKARRLVPLSEVSPEWQSTKEPGELTDLSAGLMKSIVPLILLLFLIPGVVHGYVSGTFKNHRDVIKSMAKTMSTMGYYLVMAFFAALFIDAFKNSNLGGWLAVSGANAIKAAGFAPSITIMGIILLCAVVNLLVGSASAKWALLAPIFVPMLMQLNLSPELTQAAYRVGDSTTNIITPLMPYFPLVVAFGQRYVRNTGIGTVVSMMLPFSVVFIVVWTLFLMGFWALEIPLGIQGPYTYPA